MYPTKIIKKSKLTIFHSFSIQLNISAIGFAPLVNTTEKAHDHDEYLNANTYLAGIGVYEKLIENLGNV